MISGGYYLAIDCPSCGEEITYGLCVTTEEHNGYPLIPWDTATQQLFSCDACGKRCGTGECELLSEDDL